jgi:penicillin-binding protein 1A
MKKCYADSTLTVSKEDFPRPKDLKIKVDCYGGPRKKVVEETDSTAIEQPTTEEFDL